MSLLMERYSTPQIVRRADLDVAIAQFEEVDDGIWLVSFMHTDPGYFDLERKTLRPLDNPFGTGLSPMSQVRPVTYVFGPDKAKGGGAGGIRTLDRALQPYNGLANRRLQPLGHSSIRADMPDARASRKRQIQIAAKPFGSPGARRWRFGRDVATPNLTLVGRFRRPHRLEIAEIDSMVSVDDSAPSKSRFRRRGAQSASFAMPCKASRPRNAGLFVLVGHPRAVRQASRAAPACDGR